MIKNPNDILAKIKADISKYGWSILNILPDNDKPSFSYTIGMTASFNHPELIIFGLPPKSAQAVINMIAGKIKDGTVFAEGDTVDIGSKHPLAFSMVPDAIKSTYAMVAGDLYNLREGGFRLLQIVWPDKEGRYPWNPDFDSHFTPYQPVLGTSNA